LTGPPIVFSGSESLAALWERATERWPALTLKRTKIAASNQIPTPAALTAKQYPGFRQDRLSTVERARTTSEEAAAPNNAFRDNEEWMEQEMSSPGFVPAPLGPKETAEVAATLSD
jgi:hypothetical protein